MIESIRVWRQRSELQRNEFGNLHIKLTLRFTLQ